MRSLNPTPAAVAALAILAGCNSVGAKAFNLRELRNEDGSAKLEGRAMSDLRWSLSTGLENVGLSSLETRAIRPYDNPDARAFRILNELAELDPSGPVETGHQVEIYSWLAVDDRYVLARERCVLELGAAARRLGLVTLEVPRPAAEEADLAEAVETVFAATTELATGEGGEAAWRRLVGACDAVSELSLDRTQARRALRYVNQLLETDGVSPEVFAPLTELNYDLQRTCVQRALAAALRDSHSWVRAAAQDAFASIGEEFRFIAFLEAADDPEEEVVVRWLDWVAEYGLPSTADENLTPASVGIEMPADYRRDEFLERVEELFLQIVLSRTQPSFSGRVSAAACRAMARISSANFESLRFEDWSQWYREREETLEP